MKNIICKIFLIGVFVLFALGGCDGKNVSPNGNGGEPEPEEENPIPVLATISPGSCVAHMPAFEMTVEGSDFVDGAHVVFRGEEMDTTFVSSSRLTCMIEPEDTLLSAAGEMRTYDREVGSAQAANALVKVRNPSPGGGDSNTMDFTIRDNYTFSGLKKIDWNDIRFEHLRLVCVEPGGKISVLYQRYDQREVLEHYNLIYLRQSNDYGESWEEPLQVTKHLPNAPYKPLFKVDHNGVMHCGHWREGGRVYYHQSRDNGLHWDKPVALPPSTDLPLSYWGTKFHMDVDPAGVVHCLIQDTESEEYTGNVVHERSDDGGVHWWTTDLSRRFYGADPFIVCDGEERVYAAWRDRKELRAHTEWFIGFRRSNDGGQTWEDQQIVSNESQFNYNMDVRVAVNPVNHHVYLLYLYKNDPFIDRYRIFFRKSTDNGITWSPHRALTKAGTHSGLGKISVDAAGNINVFFIQGGYVFNRRSTDGGATWTQQTVLPDSQPGRTSSFDVGCDESGNMIVMIMCEIIQFENDIWEQTAYFYRSVPYGS